MDTVAHNCHGKIFLLTATSILPRQNHSRHGKINFATAKSISPRQNQFHHGKINLATAKSISPRQTQFRHGKSSFTTAKSILQYSKISFTHDKIIFTHVKIHFTTAKSFWRACSRDISSQSAMGSLQHGGVPRGSMTQLDSTCIAPTVAIVYLKPHISACSVDKVGCN